ncbi:phosphatidylinositol N-acetylglucosaminyltransferase subunit P-like isoform X1 [Oryza brachyantha]|uniref:PIG-P domain-containing protein n=1 Tax=Oryza brachyantha TaxID=4533 RepID=J3LR25_ORYBR|nr:phosphatidylinositol N-acetylglucosaminyltransferase subunit P-like isoform X1 [Oryza brachyantha]XP_015690885.1 phosphatidylinositol N-acetylglucosaminyltransferase subunit P-like isoform X1 [Oryza brachyantha]
MEEWSSPPSPSLVVRSPRQTLSLLRNRHTGRESQSLPPTSTSLAGGPKPSEVYGFVGSITTVIATTVYLVWAYMPEHCLRSLGITYYPSRYWALAAPSFVIVATVLCMVVYMGFNFLATPPPASFNTIFDEYSRERTMVDPADAHATKEEIERPIEPISDISVDQINSLMFGAPLTRANNSEL